MPSTRSCRSRREAERSRRWSYDAEVLLLRVNGNQAAVAEIIAIFSADSGEMLRAIDAALSGWDAEALEHAAHRLKGMLMALAAPAASRAALRLEDIAREPAWLPMHGPRWLACWHGSSRSWTPSH